MSRESNQVQAIVFAAPNKVSLGTFSLPDFNQEQLLIKTEFTFVSPGTELRVLAGHYGANGRFPLIPGYACVGRVLRVGEQAKGYRVGDRVSYVPDGSESAIPKGVNSHWGGQASHHLVNASMAPIVLPENADPLDYAATEVAAISLRGIDLAQPLPGETAVVIGQGAIGAFSAAWLSARGCRTIVVDLEDSRLARGLRLGASAGVKAGAKDTLDRIRALCPDGGADIVVESAGILATAALAHQILRRAPRKFRDPITTARSCLPRLVYQANYLETIPIDPSNYFDGEGLIVLTPMDRGPSDRQKAATLIQKRAIDSRGFIDRVAEIADAPAQYRALGEDKGGVFSVVFDWRKVGENTHFEGCERLSAA